MTNQFAPEGYVPVLPNWPVGAEPWGDMSARLFSPDEEEEGAHLFHRGLGALAEDYGADSELVAEWRREWEALGEFASEALRAGTALYAAASFGWFASLDEANEHGAYLGSSGYRAAAYGGREPYEPLGVRQAASATLRAGTSPEVFRSAIDEYGPRSTHRAVAALRRGSLEAMLDARFPLSYMPLLPSGWTSARDVVAKVAYGGLPGEMISQLCEAQVSVADADFLCSSLSPEYITGLLGMY